MIKYKFIKLILALIIFSWGSLLSYLMAIQDRELWIKVGLIPILFMTISFLAFFIPFGFDYLNDNKWKK